VDRQEGVARDKRHPAAGRVRAAVQRKRRLLDEGRFLRPASALAVFMILPKADVLKVAAA